MLLALLSKERSRWSYPEVARTLSMSPSQVFLSVKRARAAGLMHRVGWKPNRTALLEFLISGAKYAFILERGGLTRGIPTAHAAPPLASEIEQTGSPPVWPDPEGPVRGQSFKPLHRSALKAARDNPRLYEALALVDAIRGGRARERELAEKHLRKLLGHGQTSAD